MGKEQIVGRHLPGRGQAPAGVEGTFAEIPHVGRKRVGARAEACRAALYHVVVIGSSDWGRLAERASIHISVFRFSYFSVSLCVNFSIIQFSDISFSICGFSSFRFSLAKYIT